MSVSTYKDFGHPIGEVVDKVEQELVKLNEDNLRLYKENAKLVLQVRQLTEQHRMQCDIVKINDRVVEQDREQVRALLEKAGELKALHTASMEIANVKADAMLSRLEKAEVNIALIEAPVTRVRH